MSDMYLTDTDAANAEQDKRDQRSRQDAMLLTAVYARDAQVGAREFVELVDMLGLDEELLGAIQQRPKLVAIVTDVRATSVELAAGSVEPNGR
jgi:hypothetical protein